MENKEFEYTKRIIEFKNANEYEVVEEMDKLGFDGWEIFQVTETSRERKSYDDIDILTEIKIYAKRQTK